MKNPVTVVAAFGLVLGGVFGMVGTVVTQRNLQAASWGIDGVGLVVATALLALKFSRRGNDVVAGFLVFAIGEGVMLSGTATTLAGSHLRLPPARPYGLPPFCSQVFPRHSPVGCVWQALLVQFFLRLQRQESLGGEQVLPTSSPLPFFAYPFLVLVFVGWIWTLLKAA